MISNQVLQSTIDGLGEIAGVALWVLDPEGSRLASTEEIPFDRPQDAKAFALSGASSQEIGERQYYKVMDDDRMEYILVLEGTGEQTFKTGRMIVFQLQGLLTVYKEHFDRDNFIKNLLLDNLLLVDIHNRAKKLHIAGDVRRAVMIVTYRPEQGVGVQEMVRQSSATGTDDFVTEVDADNVVVVKSLQDVQETQAMTQAAKQIIAYLEQQGLQDIRISYGTVASELREVSRSYKEAKMALEVGRIFSDENRVVSYTELGIGRLIYQLPIPLCKMFIREIFDGKRPGSFDEETLQTIDKFFENNLNVSETSRQLFIHRNTLVYRLDKLQKSTGLDLRVFEDAITFKIAMMVVKYMNYMEKTEF
ncbi:MAG: helix-turn-helix domain-containing protein [Lachnospiraceae bacterium]|nr:helix-turn-helix domain-containing protein [Lachnospiraceae bacterium]